MQITLKIGKQSKFSIDDTNMKFLNKVSQRISKKYGYSIVEIKKILIENKYHEEIAYWK
jgi:hypothetical protein